MAQGQGQTLHQILITANIDDVNTKISMISDMLRRLNKEWESFGTSKPTSASPMIEKLEKASRVAKESTKEQVNAEKGLTLQIKEKNKELQKTSRLMSDVARSVRDIPKDIPDIILQAEYAGKAGGVRRYLAQGIVRGTMMGSDVAETLEELQKNPVYFDAIATGIKEQADLVEGKVISLQESIISSYRQIHAIREKHKPLFDDEIESLDEFEKRIRGMKTLGELEPEREIVKAMYTQTRDVARYAAGEVPADPSLLASLQAEYSKYYQAVSKYDKERINDLETIEEFQRSSVNLTKEQAEQLRAIFSEQRRLLESEDRVAKARERALYESSPASQEMMRKLESEIAKAQTTAIKYDDQELASVIESVNALREKSVQLTNEEAANLARIVEEERKITEEQAKRENAQLDARMREVTGDKLRKQIEDVQKQMLNLQAQYPGIFTKELDALDVLNDKLNRVGNNKELQILLAQANMELQRMKEIVEEIDINETIRPDSKIFADLMYEYSRLREDTRRYNRSQLKHLETEEAFERRILALNKEQAKEEMQRIQAMRKMTRATGTPSPMTGFTERFTKISSWMTSVWSLFAVVNALQSSIRTITEMQVAMIDLRKVMDESTTNFNEMRDAAIELGQAMGRLPTEVAKVMYEFAKQGKEQAEVIELTNTALMAMNVADLDAEQAVKYLTSATLQLNMAASESSVILDAWNEVANRNAVTVETLGEAYAQTASLADSLGLSMHELNAMITILAATTGRAGGQIGRALRFAMNRAFSPEVRGILSGLNIDVFVPGTGELRSFSEILGEISDRWQEFDDATRQSIAHAFGSTVHVQTMMLLFENLGTMGVEVATQSLNSFGSAAAENEKYLQSLERRIQTLQASFTDVILALGDAGIVDAMQAVISTGNTLLSWFNSMPRAMKTLIASFVLARVSGFALSKMFGNLTKEQVVSTAATIRDAFAKQVHASATAKATAATLTFGKVAVGVSNALKALVGPWTLVTGAILTAVSVWGMFRDRVKTDPLTEMSSELNRLTDSLNKANETVSGLGAIEERIRKLKTEYRTLNAIVEEQQAIFEDFNRILPGVASSYEQVEKYVSAWKDMYEIQARTLETMTSEQRELVLKMAERDRDAAAEELKRMQDNLYKLVELYTVWRSARQEFREGLEKGLFDYEERVARSANLSRLAVELRSTARNIDPKLYIIDTPFWESQPIEYFDDIFGGLINRLIEESSIAAGELNKLIEQVDRLNSAVKAFAGATSEVDAEKAIAEFGRYAYELNKRFFSENSLYDKTIADIKSRMDSVNRTIEDMTKGMLDASNTFEKYFDLTGQGLHLYATEYARIVKLQNNLAKARMDASRSLLDEETRANLGVGSLSETSYFIVLDKAVQAHEELDSAINKNRDTLKKAYAAGVIGVQDYLVALARLDKDQSWDNHRKKIADMLDNLKSGTENAIKNAIKGFLSGADDAAEKFKEALSDVRTDALAEGISSWIQSSDYFQIQMARQQQALAAVFGAEGTRDPVEIADKQLGFLKEIKEDGETLVSVAQEIATNVANLPGAMSVVSSSLVEDALGRSRVGRELQSSESALQAATLNTIVTAMSLKGGEAVQASGGMSQFDANVRNGTITVYEVPIPQQPLVWMNDGKVPPPEDKLKLEIDTIQAPSLAPLVASVQLMIADIVGQANDVELSDMATLQDVVTQLEAIVYLASQYDSEPSIKPVLDTIEALTIYLNRELQEAEKNLMGTDISSSAESVRNALLSLSSSLSTLSAEIESASVSVQPAAGTKKVPLKDIVSGAFSNVFGGGGNNQLAPFAQDVFSKTFQFEGSADMTLEKALISMNDPRVMDELVKAAQFVYMTGGGSPSTGDMSPEAAALWPYILEAIKQGKIRLSDDWSFLQVIDRGFDEGGFTGLGGLKDIAGVVHKNEYVIPAWMMRKYPDIVKELERIRRRGFATGGSDTPIAVSASSNMSDEQVSQLTLKSLVDLVNGINAAFKEIQKFGDALGGLVEPLEHVAKILRGEFVGEAINQWILSSGLDSDLARPLGQRAKSETIGFFSNMFSTFLTLLGGYGIYRQLQKEMGGWSLPKLLGFSEGGFTGFDGSLTDVAGVVHKGEYVVPNWVLRKYPEIVAELERIRKRGFFQGGYTLGQGITVGSGYKGRAPSYSETLLSQIADNTAKVLKSTLSVEIEEDKTKDLIPVEVPRAVPEVTRPRPVNEFGIASILGTFLGRGDIPMHEMEYMASDISKRLEIPKEKVMEVLTKIADSDALKTWFGSVTPDMVKGIGEVVLEHYPEFIDGAIDSIDYWLDALDKLGVHIKELDESLWARLESIYELDYSVETWKDAFSSPRHVQNALTAMLMAMGESDSGIAWGLAAAEGLMSAAPKLQEAIREGLAARGIEVERPMDLIRGAGMLFAGMSQNRASLESGGTGQVGIPSIIGGIMSMTGIGGSMAGIVVSILSNFFKERKQLEAEQIGNVRHFIDSGPGFFDAQERFYMSGRHAALARPERVAGDDLSSLESATMGGFAQSVYQDHSSTQNTFEININGAQDPQAVAREVRRELERYTSNYGRQIKRGLRG